MKFSILPVVLILSTIKLLAQDLDLNKVQDEKKKDKTHRNIYPVEVSIGFGSYIDFSDSMLATTTYNPVYVTGVESPVISSFAIDTLGALNHQVGIELSKRIGPLRLGVSTNYMFKSSVLSGYLNNRTVNTPNYIYTYTYFDSRSHYDMKLLRANMFLDYLFLDKNKFSMYSGVGFGIMQKSSSNVHFVNRMSERINIETSENLIQYTANDSNLSYKSSSPIITYKLGLGYRISSKLRLNLDLNLFSPVDRTISVEGTHKTYNSYANQFEGDWDMIYSHSNIDYIDLGFGLQGEKSRTTYEYQNPLQIGFMFSLSYSL